MHVFNALCQVRKQKQWVQHRHTVGQQERKILLFFSNRGLWTLWTALRACKRRRRSVFKYSPGRLAASHRNASLPMWDKRKNSHIEIVHSWCDHSRHSVSTHHGGGTVGDRQRAGKSWSNWGGAPLRKWSVSGRRSLKLIFAVGWLCYPHGRGVSFYRNERGGWRRADEKCLGISGVPQSHVLNLSLLPLSTFFSASHSQHDNKKNI